MTRNKWILRVIVIASLLAAAGCDFARGMDVESDSALDAALVRTLRTRPIDQAIIVQHALYPYHFINNSSNLNELGQRDLDVLAHHFTNNPGPLNLRQGDAPEALYRARVNTVVETLVARGVERERIQIGQEPPGGEGRISDEVVRILLDQASPSPEGGTISYPGSGEGAGK